MLFEELKKFYHNKHVLVTGHTGFKGSWLALVLTKLGAKVTGYALNPPKNRTSLYNLLDLDKMIHSHYADIRDFNKLSAVILESKPDLVFHLAAQPLVRESYSAPVYNYETNIMGTVNLLEGLRLNFLDNNNLRAVINITTDKCYANQEWLWPYREIDALGGYDPYSASKACSEIITNSYRKSFYSNLTIGLASARAGNVIGGGDFSEDRIIPDIINSIANNNSVVLRNPNAVRPWQHVFDVLNGYLILGQKVYQQPEHYSQAYNFSPDNSKVCTVKNITDKFICTMGYGSYEIDSNSATVHEAQMLQLDSSKAKKQLGWQAKLDVDQALEYTAGWYKKYLESKDTKRILDHSHQMIDEFFGLAVSII